MSDLLKIIELKSKYNAKVDELSDKLDKRKIVDCVNIALECVDLASECRKHNLLADDVFIRQCDILVKLSEQPEYQAHILRNKKLNRIL